jgi:23S rRNA (uracil1939-C5)-methyltransferase
MAEQTIEVEIVAIGGRGDGIAETGEGRFFVPYTVPGDRLRLTIRDGTLLKADRLADGADRRAPACRHFGECGGCALQHLRDDVYSDWKRLRIVEALARQGLDVEVEAPIRIAPGTRRRVRLGARRTAKRLVLGYKARRSHRLVDVSECPIARAGIVALLPALRDLLSSCLPRSGAAEVSVTEAENGLDVSVDTSSPLDLERRERLAVFAASENLARLAWGGEPVAQRRAPLVRFAGIPVELPPGGFLQSTREGEEALTGIVLAALASADNVADLFAGCGAFALPLAQRGKKVRAFDSVKSQTDALRAAAREPRLAARTTVETRDLERRPLAGPELADLDGLVLDPPRAGAAAQVREIAVAPVPVVAYASCSPSTFARDARILADGGYRLDGVTPVDQFLWSAEVELIAVFRR